MTQRRSRGDGGLRWDTTRERWVAEVTIGYTPAGKRIVRRGRGKTKTAAKDKLKQILRDHKDGVALAAGSGYTVAHAVNEWLCYGLSAKTRRSRRTLALPRRCVEALEAHRCQQDRDRVAAGSRWQEHGLVFASRVGGPFDPSHVRREFRRAIQHAAGLDAVEWTPRELRYSFVSLLSDSGVPLEEISRLVGHSGTAVTELVYRKQIRPVLQRGAAVMDQIFRDAGAAP
ncbi:MAG: tyrosine-type recombinase/integrase [Actinobacteria bacterium]|nr:tyrosine-type recombinase/integrase [Actinomycetota bacterium]